MTAGRIAVVGASAAGLAAAEALRRRGWTGTLTMVGAEQHLPYDRPPLSKQVLLGSWDPQRTQLRPPGKLDPLDLDLRLGTRATGLDVIGRRLELSGVQQLDCDGMILATGVHARTLPGTDGVEGVHTLRTLDDAVAFRDRLDGPARRIAVIGMGVLGSEVAAVTRAAGHDVALIGAESAPMEAVVGPHMAGLLAEVHRAHGVELRPGSVVDSVLTHDGHACGARLTDGTRIAADTVLVAIGSTPNVDWLRATGVGLDLTDGIGCDSYCAAAPGIYAAGDVARWHHPGLDRALRVEHRMNATEQGMAAAGNLLAELSTERFGAAREFAPVSYFWSDQYSCKLQAYGDLSHPDHTELVVLDDADAASPRAVALYGRGERAIGAAAIGVPPKQARALRGLVSEPLPWDDASGQLSALVS